MIPYNLINEALEKMNSSFQTPHRDSSDNGSPFRLLLNCAEFLLVGAGLFLAYKKLVGKPELRIEAKSDETVVKALQLSSERAVQTLKLDIASKDETIGQLRRELQRQRLLEAESANAKALSQRLELANRLVTPAVHILTQTHLSETEGKVLQTKDVLAVAKRMVSGLKESGVEFIGQIGQQASFDETKHEMLGGGHAERGEPVVIKTMGAVLEGNIIQRIGVISATV